jgi:cytochrome c-type biogenesis protein CcmH
MTRGPKAAMTLERMVILVALLAILGAVAWSARPHEATAAERVDRITSELRCVTCQGLSVKDSPAASARQMRDLVVQRVAEGRTDDEIRDEFRAAYGDWVLLSPPTTSWTALIWLVPLAALGAGLAVALARMRPGVPNAVAPSPRDLAALRERVAREEALDLPQADGA